MNEPLPPRDLAYFFRAKSRTPETQAITIVNMLKEAGFTNKDAFAFEVNNKVGSNKNKTATKNEMLNNLYHLIQRIIDSDLPFLPITYTSKPILIPERTALHGNFMMIPFGK
ncbi:MAG: hypothetical protein ACR5LD_08805 [Symbiopectobacterium sp.]